MIRKLRHGHTNYRNIKRFISALDKSFDNDNFHKHYTAEGYMDLVVEYIGTHNILNLPAYSIAHYYTQNDDLMRDPEMVIAVDYDNETVYPCSFTQDNLGMYQEVYFSQNGTKIVRKQLRTDLDNFLYSWLNNINIQGF